MQNQKDNSRKLEIHRTDTKRKWSKGDFWTRCYKFLNYRWKVKEAMPRKYFASMVDTSPLNTRVMDSKLVVDFSQLSFTSRAEFWTPSKHWLVPCKGETKTFPCCCRLAHLSHPLPSLSLMFYACDCNMSLDQMSAKMAPEPNLVPIYFCSLG